MTPSLDSFQHLIAEYQDDVFAVALATVLDRSLAEDITQETFVTAYTHLERLRDPAALGGWLAAIARNHARDILRRRKREHLVDVADAFIPTDDATPSDDLDKAALRREVRDAIARVPPKYREVLVLYYAQERPIDAVADALGLSRAAALQRLSRGRKLVARHGAKLRELAQTRPPKSLAALVLLLIHQRTEAHNVGSGQHAYNWRPAFAGFAVVLGAVSSNEAHATQVLATPTIEISVAEPDEPISTAVRVTHSIVAPARSGSMPRPRPIVTPVANERPWRSVAMAIARPPLDAEIPVVPCPEACTRASTVPAPAKAQPRPYRWEITNGFLETAQLPDAETFTFETIAMGVQVRAGLTEHLAVHAGMMGIDIEEGSYRNAGMALGGGIKLGAAITPRAKIAVVAEAAREVNAKTLEAGAPWLGRAYAALTFGRGRNLLTFNGGVTAIDNGDPRWVSPMLGIASYIGWDDNLGFVAEHQFFRRARGETKNTSVFAVRFRDAAVSSNPLGLSQARIDVGVLVLGQDAGPSTLPWLQAGLGW